MASMRLKWRNLPQPPFFNIIESRALNRMLASPMKGEIDHLGRDAAVEYLLMPERVKTTESGIESIRCELVVVNRVLQKFAEKFQYLFSTDEIINTIDTCGNKGYAQ